MTPSPPKNWNIIEKQETCEDLLEDRVLENKISSLYLL